MRRIFKFNFKIILCFLVNYTVSRNFIVFKYPNNIIVKYIPLLLISRCIQSAPKLLRRTSALFVVLPIIAPPLLYLLSINHYYLLCQNINPMMHQKDHHHLPLHFALIDCYYLELAYCTLFCP